MNILEYNTVLI